MIENANYFGGLSTPNGNIFLDLTGYHDSAPYGGVEQTINTTPGQTYQLSFELGVNNSLGYAYGPASVSVTAGASSTILTANPSGSGMIWTAESFEFTATSSTTTIAVQGNSTAGGGFIGLDNVSVTIPPSSSDFYKFYLNAGQSASLAAQGLNNPVSLGLLDGNGNVLTVAAGASAKGPSTWAVASQARALS